MTERQSERVSETNHTIETTHTPGNKQPENLIHSSVASLTVTESNDGASSPESGAAQATGAEVIFLLCFVGDWTCLSPISASDGM